MQQWKPSKPPFSHYKKTVFSKTIKTGTFIYHIGETPALRKPSQTVPIKSITSKIFQQKIAYLKQCLLQYRKLTGVGRGITGVQVGIPERVSVIYMPELPGSILTVINPKVFAYSKEKVLYPEICMSAAPLIAPTVRPAWVEVLYYDEKGKEQRWTTRAVTKQGKLYNRVLQHEIDHMDGIINIDRVSSKELIFECDPSYYEKATFQKPSR